MFNDAGDQHASIRVTGKRSSVFSRTWGVACNAESFPVELHEDVLATCSSEHFTHEPYYVLQRYLELAGTRHVQPTSER